MSVLAICLWENVSPIESQYLLIFVVGTMKPTYLSCREAEKK